MYKRYFELRTFFSGTSTRELEDIPLSWKTNKDKNMLLFQLKQLYVVSEVLQSHKTFPSEAPAMLDAVMGDFSNTTMEFNGAVNSLHFVPFEIALVKIAKKKKRKAHSLKRIQKP